jgi:hypothetical protein
MSEGLRRIPVEELAEPYRSRAISAINDSGDAIFLQTAMNAPHMVDWYYFGFYPEIFNKGIVAARIKELCRLRLAQLHLCGH